MWYISNYMDHWLHGLSRNLQSLITILIALVIGIILRFVLHYLLRFYLWGTNHLLARLLLKNLRGIMLVVLPVFMVLLFMPIVELRPDPKFFIQRIFQIIFIMSFAILLVRLAFVAQDMLFYYFDTEKPDNMRARKMRTQILFIRKIAVIIILVLALAMVFTRFEGMRRIGSGILTSAGVLGIIIGFAAQRSLANLLAGLQIAFTQPIRIDDVVIVEGEWGRIEEITFTYVVVRIWDMRRMILPITYFIEKPFQNWTRISAELMGTVFLHLDYTVPVNELRLEMQRVVKGSSLWDGKVCELQVTDTTEKTIEVRCIVSAANSGNLFDLRCLLREALVDFVQKNYPNSLPRFRVDGEPR